MTARPRAAPVVGFATAVLCLLSAAASAAEIHHAIVARLDPATGALAVEDVITLSGRDGVTLRLAPWQRIVTLALDGRPVAPAPAGTKQRLALPDRSLHRIAVALEGRVPPMHAGPGAGGDAASGPDGAYLPGWSGWLPDTGDRLIRHRTEISVPAPHRAVVTGRLVEEEVRDGERRAVYAADRAGELPSVFAGPYRVSARTEGGLVVRTYLHAELAGLAESYQRAAAAYVGRYAKRIGAYPYPAFSVVSSPLPVGLGFPALTYVGRTVLPMPFMRGRSLAHEVLHSWWGNAVAVDYPTGNWSEGLTTYMADYALAADRSAEAARAMRIGWLRDFAALPPERDAPVRRFRGKRHDASQVVGYNKTAFVFHMLRAELGEAAFDAGLRDFWQRHRFAVAGWADLRAAFERTSGRDLGWFFAQWLDRPGAPALALDGVSAHPDGGAYVLRFTVRQTPPVFRLSLPVRIVTEAGETRQRIALGGESTAFALALPARPKEIQLDPGFDVFRRLAAAETPPILRDVTLAENTTLIVAASGPEDAAAAGALGRLLMDAGARRGDGAGESLPDTPVLIVGTDAAVASLLARAGLKPPPPAVTGAGGTARAWTIRRDGGLPVLVVSGRDRAALEALRRPLPHYGRRSFVLFDGPRAIRQGVWPLGDSPLRRVLKR